MLISIFSFWAGILLATAAAYGHEEYLPPVPLVARPAGPTLATVNGIAVTLRDYHDAVTYQERQSLTSKEILQKAIHRELLRQEGLRLGFDKDPVLTKRLEQLRRVYIKEEIRKREVDRLGEIPEIDLRQYYEAHKEEFTTKEQVVASHILLKSREAAEAVLAQLRNGADFAPLARERSEDSLTRSEGGRLPAFSSGQMSPEFEKVAFALKPGELSGVVEDTAGFHLITVHEHIPATVKPLEAVKRRVQEWLIEERLRSRFEELYADVEQKSVIKYKEEAIKKLMAPPPDNLEPDVVLASVNGTSITVRDFAQIFVKLERARKAAARKDPKPLIRSLIYEELLQQEGLRLGLDQDPALVQYLEQVKRKYLVDKVTKPAMAKASAVPEEAVRQYYGAHQDEFTDPEMLAVSHILLKSREAAEAVLAQLRNGADFAPLARERSEDSLTRSEGGRRFIRRGQMSLEFEKVAFALKPGELSGIVEDRAGFYIVKLHRHQPVRRKALEEVRRLIHTNLATQAQKAAFEQYLAELEKQATIEISEEELAKGASQPVPHRPPFRGL